MLERTKHRQATITALTGATAAGARVYDSRLDPYSFRELPALSVNAEKQTGDLISMSPPTYRQTLTLEIDCAVTTSTGWADALDALAEQVIVSLLTVPEYVQRFETITLNSVTNHYEEGDSAQIIAVATVSLQLIFGETFAPQIEDTFDSIRVTVTPADPEASEPLAVLDLDIEQ